MKHSIHKIFKNLFFSLLLALCLATISLLFIVEQYNSYQKVINLNTQKAILTQFSNNQAKNNFVDIIEFNNKIATLNSQIEKIQIQQHYNYISNIVLGNFKETKVDILTLSDLVQQFNQTSREYFKLNPNDKNMEVKRKNLETLSLSTLNYIDKIILKNIAYDNARFNLFIIFFALLLIVLFFITLWYRNRLNKISKDILFLYSIDSDKHDMNIFSQEVDAIHLRMKRKTNISDNPIFIDQITEINNNKGMVQAYAEKKGLNENNFSSLTILEIDNFSKSKRTFSQEFTQEILKKVAYTISLHQQASDIIARTDYNQFTVIFSRASKDQLFKDVDLIRQSIAEIKLISPEQENIKITVTGGFITRNTNAPLEDTIKKAKELLINAKNLGHDKILQTKDVAK